MNRSELILYWSDEEGVDIAEVPELADCAADGLSNQDAITNVEIVINEWIETAKAPGRSVPEPKGGRLILAEAPGTISSGPQNSCVRAYLPGSRRKGPRRRG